MNPEAGARQLFEGLLGHEGPDAYATVVGPWSARAGDGYRDLLTMAAAVPARPASDGPDVRPRHLLWELYALSRVSDVLLLSFQPPGHDHWDGPGVTTDQYLDLFTGLGAVPFEETAVFDPFLHEIVEVEQAADPDEPVVITGLVWPGLWLGSVLFGRAGVRVRAGVRHAERGVADRSPLYWTHRRRHRPTVDLSRGWGHNSQWRTDFRVDLRTGAGDRANAEGTAHVDDVEDGTPEALLTAAERRDLLRHRCLVRTPVRAAELAGAPGWETDLFPFDWHAET
ncbi:hypothetical protein [Streptomyces sp. NPDC058964]|uniref:hypothetical protein n=1 Tax=Streptomyces sp. NPDC058964 TaxID=3346681 RepID=UPI00367F4B42